MKLITDATNNAEGFSDVNKTGVDYVYDSFGNMIADKNKNITAISYNHLNLPYKVTFANGGNISFVYDAAGTRLSKKVQPNGGALVTTDYIGGFQYKNNQLQFFFQPEGLVEYKNNQYIYHYIYKDLPIAIGMGNNRLVYADLNKDGVINPATEIIEENNYYPFGLKHKGYNELSTENPAGFKYKYNGKEYQDELGLNMYDYGARNYDPAIGRWGTTDNKAEFYFANSPYVYALNQPTNAIDPDGNLVIFINGLGGGGAEYWKEYKRVLRYNSNFWNQGSSISYRKEVVKEFDVRVSYRLNDHNRMYIDGSPGNLAHNISSENRYNDGYQAGKSQAVAIIGSLARDPQGNITETIKIITHSMGGVYGKGFVKALKEYIKNSKDSQVRKALITLVADFDPFQAGSKYGKADPNTYTQQFIHEGWSDITGFGSLANEEEEGADEVRNNKKKSSHFISTFIDDVSNLRLGTYKWDDDKEEWICITCN